MSATARTNGTAQAGFFNRLGRFFKGSPGKTSSLELPHGDPLPKPPGSAGPPDVGTQGLRGTYTAVGYRAARIAEQEGRSPSRAGSVIHERLDRLKLQYQSREFVRDNGLYRGMLKRARAYIVGRGFKLQVRSKSPEWNRDVEARWNAWWKQPEITGQFSGRRLEAMVMDELLVCGETGVILTDDRKAPRTGMPDRDNLQHVEAEQIMGRDWTAQGIERDELRRPLKYWVSPYEPQTGYVLREKAAAYTPDSFLYIASPERPSANRAVPPCEAAFPMLHRINDVCDSEAIAWQMQAKVALISNRESGLLVPGTGTAVQRTGTSATTQGDITQGWITELPTALIFHGKTGDKLSGMERTAPGGNFTETLTMFFRLLGLPLGLPLELILLDWTHSNYSQSRAVLEQAFTMFLDWQDLLVDLFHDRVFAWWLERSVARAEIRGRSDQLAHDWIRPTFPWIDQLAEAEAQGEKVDRGFATHTAVLKSLNLDRDEHLDDLKLETIEAIEAAQEVEEATGVPVPWEPFAGKKPPNQPAELDAEKDAQEGGAADETTKGAVKKKAAALAVERKARRDVIVQRIRERAEMRRERAVA